MSDLVQPASLASWPELGAELPASTWNVVALDSELIPKYTFHTTVVLLPHQ
jgi:hypothetical protein